MAVKLWVVFSLLRLPIVNHNHFLLRKVRVMFPSWAYESSLPPKTLSDGCEHHRIPTLSPPAVVGEAVEGVHHLQESSGKRRGISSRETYWYGMPRFEVALTHSCG